MVLEVSFDLKNAPNMKRNAIVFFWRLFFVEFFSGKFGEICAKILHLWQEPRNG